MTAATALRLAQAANVSITLDGNDLLLEAGCAPPPELLEMISRYKGDVIALLRARPGDWTVADWKAFFNERAGIAEYDGGLSRHEAEAVAFEHCVEEWLRRHPVRSSPRVCLGCGRVEDERGIVMPFGTETSGHVWLHSDCWPAWYHERMAEAVAVLRTMGIMAPDVILPRLARRQPRTGLSSR
jgi:hypothetical protein